MTSPGSYYINHIHLLILKDQRSIVQYLNFDAILYYISHFDFWCLGARFDGLALPQGTLRILYTSYENLALHFDPFA
jgi:hypothetical protein